MRRGQERRPSAQESGGFTKQELLDVSGLSARTFDMIRKAARVRGPGHGGLGWVFSPADVEAMIRRARSGSFSERGAPAAAGWQALLDQR